MNKVISIILVIMCVVLPNYVKSNASSKEIESNINAKAPDYAVKWIDATERVNIPENLLLDEYNIQYYGFLPQYTDDMNFQSVIKVRSVEELQNNKEISEFTNHYKDKYNEAFFEDSFLILILIVEGSGSVKNNISSVDQQDNSIDILIDRYQPEVGTCDMSYHLISVEMNRDSLDKKVSVLFMVQ